MRPASLWSPASFDIWKAPPPVKSILGSVMNVQDNPNAFAVEKFAIGQPVPRGEDPKLVQGQGRYTDDVSLPNQAFAVILRSRHAHGVIRRIDTSAAKGMPGVLAVYTAADLAAVGYAPLKTVMPLKGRDGNLMKVPTRYALATDKVRFVGDPIACVVAETVHQGKDAAQAIEVDIDPLPAVITPREAVKAGAPQLYEDVPGNVACDWHFGDTAKVEQAFKEAAHVVKMPLRNTRLVVNAMEPRGFVASYDKASSRFTVYTGGQSTFGQKMATAEVLKVTPDKVHAMLGNVGGSFGMKAPVFPEYVCVLHAAREMGIDRIELRRRNHIKPKEIPYKTPSDNVYDSGDFPAVLKRVMELADYKGFGKRKRESRKRGKLRGIGVGSFLEVTAPQAKELGGIRFEADGTVTIITGTLDFGQGHWTPFAQVLATKLGVPFDKIRLLQGDSDQLPLGGGTGGSKSAMMSGTAIAQGAEKVIEQGKPIAAFVLEAATGDIEFHNGRFVIAGTDRAIGIMELAAKLRGGLKLPPDIPQTLNVMHVSDGVPATYPNGAHVAEVEIDPDTGIVEVVKYVAVNDFGTELNPLLVAGQVHGGLVQGLGQALMENTVYNEDGQLLTGSYMDYAMPRAADAPNFTTESQPSPATTNPLGVKGCGEAGCAGSLVSINNAIADALADVGVKHLDMPATPERVWQAIKGARVATQ